jgi:hypothetical protein
MRQGLPIPFPVHQGVILQNGFPPGSWEVMMIAKFENDIFISYAHIDNEPLAEGLKGWVEAFHERLRVKLTQMLGEEPSIWRDLKLQGNDKFSDTLVARVGHVGLLVSVLSPRYVKSEWCLREIEEFARSALASGGLQIGDKLRIFKVLKTHIPLEEHPLPLRETLGYEFFEYDPARGRAKEFSQEVVPARDIRYWEKLDDIAYDIKQMLETLKGASGQPSVGAPGLTIYLAETTSDLCQERERIKRELMQHGHTVLPDKALPLVGGEIERVVSDFLARSQMSVHLIGGPYGIIPEGQKKSVVHLQSDLALDLGDRLQRIVWMPIGIEGQDDAQQRFIDQFRMGRAGGKATEVLQTRLEELKTLIQERIALKIRESEIKQSPVSNGDRPSVYLISDKQDIGEAMPVADYLFDHGLDVTQPATEGEEALVLEDHKENLLSCDAAMIYYGRASEIWLRMKQRELQKIAGYGRTSPMAAKAIYISGPATESKERVRVHDALVIKSYEGFAPDQLVPFIDQVQKAKGVRL